MEKNLWNVTNLIKFRQTTCISWKNAVKYMLYGKAFCIAEVKTKN